MSAPTAPVTIRRARGGVRRRALAIMLTAVACATAVPAAADAASPAPFAAFDLSEYLGSWHQLAAVPQAFNLVCARDTQARYSLSPRGDVTVRNSCTTWTGQMNRIKGTATVLDTKTHARLHVSFPGIPNPDRGRANYIVTAVGPDYSWAHVTDSRRGSGFVLSRTPSLSSKQWSAVRRAIARAGNDDCLYLTSPTTGGFEQIRRLCD